MKKLEKLSSKLKDYINKRNFIYMITENTKALLAAGLIGTASLGMQSCAQPTGDDPYYGDGTNTEVTTPAPTDNTTADNPTDNTTTDTTDNTKKGGETVKTEEQNWVDTFGQLLTYSEENKIHAERLANAECVGTVKGGAEYVDDTINYIYTGNGFEKLAKEGKPDSGVIYGKYTSSLDYVYHIPTNKADSLINACKKITNQI